MMQRCVGCGTLCDDGELLDDERCFDCWITWRWAEDVREAEQATGYTGRVAERIAVLRAVARGRHARAW